MKRLFVSFLVFSAMASDVLAQDAKHEEPVPFLIAGSTVSDSLAFVDVHTYAVDLTADQFVYGEVDQLTVDVVITIFGPDGEMVSAFDSQARGPEPFYFTSHAAGPYRVDVTPFEKAQGRYAVTLKRVEPLAETPQGRVDQLMAPYESDEMPGGVVAVVRNGEMVFARGYGMAELEYQFPNTPETAYHMASVSKQFTAFAIAMLVEQGTLSLDDDVRTYIPELPEFGTTITLRHLLTHTSGLRDQWSLWTMSGGRMDDVIRQEDLMRLIERQRELNFEPGEEFLYSNTGYMLLAEVVGRTTGVRFADWMWENVFEPLGMRSTQIYDDHERLVRGRAYSYQYGDGGIKKAVLSYANSGATSLFTTAEDLAKWLRNFRTAEVGGPEVVKRMQERGILINGDTLNYALGLGIGDHRGLRRIQHGGADAGYRTMLAYYPDIDAGVIVLSNFASFNAGRTAAQVAEAFFGKSMELEQAKQDRVGEAGVTVALDRMAPYAGTFITESGSTVRLTLVTGELYWQRDEGSRARLSARSDTEFRVEVPWADIRISFHVEPDGRVERGTIHQNGDTPIRRVEPWNPDVRELESYAGRYFSPELETFYTIGVENDQLIAQHRRHGDLALTPKAKDAFGGSEWFFRNVRFERDDAGVVTGLRASNGRVRNLFFEKRE